MKILTFHIRIQKVKKYHEKNHEEKFNKENNEININIGPSDNINLSFDNLISEQNLKTLDVNFENQKQFDSIKDCSQAEKRILAKDFQIITEIVQNYYDEFQMSLYSKEDFYLIDTIDTEISQFHYLLYELMKNKISLSDIFESLTNCIYFIESDLESDSYPKSVEDYGLATIKELNKIKDRIISLSCL